MGKRKETSEDDTRASFSDYGSPPPTSISFVESSSTSPKKKHKRKHKKHKKRKDHGPEGHDEERKKERSKEKSKSKEKESDNGKGGGRAVKLKIKLRGETMATTQMAKIVPVKLKEPVISSGEEDELADEDNFQQSWQEGTEKEEPEIVKKEHGDSDEQEEQKWLDALEKGELDDFGRVKQDKDVSMMTARQRAMLGHEIEGENQLLELPTEPRRKNEDSEEAQKRRKQRAKKRKQQMQKKIEENKTQTVKKLLDREATRSRKEEEKARRKKQQVPHIRYISNQTGFALSFSKGLEFPLEVQLPQDTPKPRFTCSAQGCTNLKKYACSSNNLPVCSMECYKKVQLIQIAVV
ncbi:INO80 complex subunit B [Acropora cervicornis]|uniref:INO80 complex subunit B n=1 Tax=Acropora cervicornis TaxID=6130 RepID=A0AAD9PVE7_ACRCE|nr:INO80 complex subunit B [Acropora cervicornis]